MLITEQDDHPADIERAIFGPLDQQPPPITPDPTYQPTDTDTLDDVAF